MCVMREGQSVLGEPVLFALDVWKGGDRVRLVDWPQAVLSLTGAGSWMSLSVVRGEVMLIQRTLRAGGEPQAMSHTGGHRTMLW